MIRTLNGIDLIDQGVLSSFFNAGGYVLNFTTSGFDDFTMGSVGVPLCATYGLSKGKSLAEFVRKGKMEDVVRLFQDLIRHYEANYEELLQDEKEQRKLCRLKEIVGKYSQGLVAQIATPAIKNVDYTYIKEMSERANQDVEKGTFDSALTKARTLLEEVFCKVIEKKGETPIDSGEIRGLYNQVKTLYKMHQNSEYDKRINGLLSGLEKILTAVAEMRNGASDSHGVGQRRLQIEKHHARLMVNSAQTMAEFILAVSERNGCSGKDLRR